MFRIALLVFILLIQSATDFAAGYPLFSPDQKIRLEVTAGRKLEYAIWYGNDAIIIPSSIALHLNNGKILGYNADVISSSRDSVRTILYPVVAVKNKKVVNSYNQLTINFPSGFSAVFRVYNDGVAGSEPTHIYDPKHSLFFAWKEIIRHWKMLFSISMQNKRKGFPFLKYKDGMVMFKENMEYVKMLDEIIFEKSKEAEPVKSDNMRPVPGVAGLNFSC